MSKARQARLQAAKRRDRRALFALIAGAGLLLGVAGIGRAYLGPAPRTSIGGPFTLVDPEGRPQNEASFPGRFELIFFGYTRCADFCPRTLSEMSEALDRLDPAARHIQPLFITVDPQHDTPERLRRYTAGFSPNLIGLTGTFDALRAARENFRVTVEPESPDGKAENDLDHTGLLYLLDPAGRLVAVIPAQSDRNAIGAALRMHVPALAAA